MAITWYVPPERAQAHDRKVILYTHRWIWCWAVVLWRSQTELSPTSLLRQPNVGCKWLRVNNYTHNAVGKFYYMYSLLWKICNENEDCECIYNICSIHCLGQHINLIYWIIQLYTPKFIYIYIVYVVIHALN